MKDRVFAGIQPSGEIHIGNYLGAIQNWVTLLESYECFFCVVDYHALTIDFDPTIMKNRIWNTVMDLIACGVDAQKSCLFVQSMVSEHTELAWILSTVIGIGHLERMTQYKEKSQQNQDNVNLGLLSYPVLQTADILLYKAEKVPVGQDQVQHLELAREIARSFNRRYGTIFPEPQALLSSTPKLPGLDGKNKMSKSQNNTIFLREDKKSIQTKIQKTPTDPNRKRRSDPGNPNVCPIFSLHGFFTETTKKKEIDSDCRIAKIGCVDCKQELLKGIQNLLTPIQEKRTSLEKNKPKIQELIFENGKHAKEMAQETLKQVKESIGISL